MEAVYIVCLVLYALLAIGALAFGIFIWVKIFKLIGKIAKKFLD